MKRILLPAIVVSMTTTPLWSQQDGDLDVTFGNAGLVRTDLGSWYDEANAIALQADNKIVVGGRTKVAVADDFALCRYHTNGDLDSTFGTNGVVVTDIDVSVDRILDIAVQTDDKIVAIGTGGPSIFDFVVVRYLPDGDIDSSFNGTGKLIIDINTTLDVATSVAIQTDGKILVAGGTDPPGFGAGLDSDFALVRLNTDGSFDIGFGVSGIVTTDFNTNNDQANAIKLDGAGNIYACGYTDDGSSDFALAKYLPDGTLDVTFGTAGRVTTDFNATYDNAKDLDIGDNGQIVLAGYATPGIDSTFFALAQYNSDGLLDTTFNGIGQRAYIFPNDLFGTFNEAQSVFVQPDGKIVAGGYMGMMAYNNFAMLRVHGNGSVDTTFGTNGKVITDFTTNSGSYDIFAEQNGYILLAGVTSNVWGDTTNFALAKYHSGFTVSSPYASSQTSGASVYPNPFADVLNIDLPFQTDQSVTVELFDVSGRRVYYRDLEGNSDQWSFMVPRALSAGSYVLRVSGGEIHHREILLKN